MNVDRRLLAGAVLLLLLAFAGGMKYEAIRAGQAQEAQKLVEQEQEPENGRSSVQQDAGEKSTITVYVSGEVRKPGVYSLQAGDRWYQAIELAGGTLEQADLKHLEMARGLVDGQNVYVPAVGEEPAVSAGQGAAAATGGSGGGKLNINLASADEMDQQLDGIGPALAQRIIDYRTANGPFQAVEDLKNVSGIGDKKFEAVKDSICVN